MPDRYSHKTALGDDYTFIWVAPDPLEAASTPTLTIKLTSGDITPTLTRLHAPVDVTALAKDKRKLTAPTATIASARGAQGEYGDAFLVSESDGNFPVKVSQVLDGFIRLANALPRTSTGVGVIQWAVWTATIPAAQLPVVEIAAFVVAYKAKYGLDVPTANKTTRGTLRVVLQPFTTGLNTTTLVNAYPDLGTLPDHASQGFETQIDFAEQELISILRAQLVEQGLTEDEVDGPSLRAAHAALTAAHIYSLTSIENSAILRTRATELIEMVLKSVWVDANKDGDVDDDEATTHVTGGRGSDVGGGTSDNTPTFSFSSSDR